MGVLADEQAEFCEPPLEGAGETLLVCELLGEALGAPLQPLNDLQLGVDCQPQGANLRGLRGRDVFVELLDEAENYVGALPVDFVKRVG